MNKASSGGVKTLHATTPKGEDGAGQIRAKDATALQGKGKRIFKSTIARKDTKGSRSKLGLSRLPRKTMITSEVSTLKEEIEDD